VLCTIMLDVATRSLKYRAATSCARKLVMDLWAVMIADLNYHYCRHPHRLWRKKVEKQYCRKKRKKKEKQFSEMARKTGGRSRAFWGIRCVVFSGAARWVARTGGPWPTTIGCGDLTILPA